MTRDQFETLAATWGSDVERWPAELRDAARAFAASPAGASILEQHRDFDRLFAIAPDVAPGRTELLGFQVLMKLAAPEAERPRSWFRALRWSSFVPATSLACSVLVGVWLAGAVPYNRSESDPLAVMNGMFDSYAIAFGVLQ